MTVDQTIYILGAGAVGFPLAVHLTQAGRRVLAVRTSRADVPRSTVTITVHNGVASTRAAVETVSLAHLPALDGLLVVTAKAHGNRQIAADLKAKGAKGPVVILQNGVGVERPFLEAGFAPLYRCILYVTAQAEEPNEYLFRPVTAAPVGVVVGGEDGLHACVTALSTEAFSFRAEPNIQREIWKKAIINAAFNSICPLLNVDNGIFARDEEAAALARQVIAECVALTDRLDLGLGEDELMQQLLLVSSRSDGQLISTLQDIRAGRPTEIPYLNMEIARVAAALQPALYLPATALLGRLVLLKAAQASGTA